MKQVFTRVLLVLLFVVFGLTTSAHAAAPANDLLRNALILDSISSGHIEGTNVSAALEIGDMPKVTIPVGRSVWYVWKSPGTFAVTFKTEIPEDQLQLDTVLAVYRRTTNSNTTIIRFEDLVLEQIDDDNGEKRASRITFTARPSVQYYIVVAGRQASQGHFGLTWQGEAVNDTIPRAFVLKSGGGREIGNNNGAGFAGEDNVIGWGDQPGRCTVWFKWRRPSSMVNMAFAIASVGTDFNPRLFVCRYKDSKYEIVARGSTTAPVTLKPIEEIYFIAVDGTNGSTGTFSLTYGQTTRDDKFPPREISSSLSGALLVNTFGGTPDKENPEGFSASVWYGWTPPVAQNYTIYTTDSDFSDGIYLGVFERKGLQLVAGQTGRSNGRDGNAAVRITTKAKTNYVIVLAGKGGTTGNCLLRWAPTPKNDDMASATPLIIEKSFKTRPVNLATAAATAESHERNHASGVSPAKTLWYSFTIKRTNQKPWTKLVTLSLQKSSSPAYLAAYHATGGGFSNLILLATTIAGDENVGTNTLTFVAEQGKKYLVAVDSAIAEGGTGTLTGTVTNTNDDIQRKVAIGGVPGQQDGSTHLASHDEKDPRFGSMSTIPTRNSVWYVWLAPQTGKFRFWVESPTGGLGLMALPLNNNDTYGTALAQDIGDAPQRLTSINFSAIAKRRYYILVDARSTTGAFRLRWDSGLDNDDLTGAEPINGPTSTITSTTLGASRQTGEPAHVVPAARHSVWYRWKAPVAGNYRFRVSGQGFQAAVAVYEMHGTTFSKLKTLKNGDVTTGAFSFPAVVREYAIAVDGIKGTQGTFSLSWEGAPSNDDFAHATRLGKAFVVYTGTTKGASPQSSEPGKSRSVWYLWPKQGAKSVSFVVESEEFEPHVRLFANERGKPGSEIQNSADSTKSGVFDLTPEAGIDSYFVSVDNIQGEFGSFTLVWAPTPDNDWSQKPSELAGASGNTAGWILGAGAEDGEPPHQGIVATNSVWYRWQAPAAGVYSFEASAHGWQPLVAGYTSILPRAHAIENLGSSAHHAHFRFAAQAGTIYYLAVDTVDIGKGQFALAWKPDPLLPPPNDNWINAMLLSGANGETATTLLGATVEPGEAMHAGYAAKASIWFRWIAPADGTVRFLFSSDDAGVSLNLAAYHGDSLSTLEEVGRDTRTGLLRFAVNAGKQYLVVADVRDQKTSDLLLTWAMPPANAAVSRATLISGSAGLINDNSAGLDSDQALWYKWQAPASTRFVFFTAGSHYDTILKVFRDPLAGSDESVLESRLELVASNDDLSTLDTASGITLNAVEGVTYYIAVWGKEDDKGDLLLSWNLPPANDNFASAKDISPDSDFTDIGYNVGASHEVDEPQHADDSGRASLWYRWRTTQAQLITFTTAGSNFDTLLAIYASTNSGSSLSGLQLIKDGAKDDDDAALNVLTSSVTFLAKPDTDYYIAVDGKDGAAGLLRLTWKQQQPNLINDDLGNAIELYDLHGVKADTNTGATAEVTNGELNEPEHAGQLAAHSVWYKWQTSQPGQNVTFDVLGNFDTVLAVYQGPARATRHSQLRLVADNDNSGSAGASRVTFTPQAGVWYYIVVDGATGASGDFDLSWAVRPSNDSRAQPINLGSDDSSAANVYTNTGIEVDRTEATQVAQDFRHLPWGGHAVWFRWQPKRSFTVTFHTGGSDFNTILGIYRKDKGIWIPLTANDDEAADRTLFTSNVQFSTVRNAEYLVVVDGAGGATGNIHLQWGPTPSNDDLRRAIALGKRTTVEQDTIGATFEPSEPRHAGITGGRSIWYSWVAPATGRFTFDTLGSDFDTLLAVYTGSRVEELSSVTSNDESASSVTSVVTLSATIGQRYLIAIDGVFGATGHSQLNWYLTPNNDGFLEADPLPLTGGTLDGTTAGATAERGEPFHADNLGGHSVWYSWTAPQNAHVEIKANGNFPLTLAAYLGVTVEQLTQVATDIAPEARATTGAILSFNVARGRTYSFAVDNYATPNGSTSTGVFTLDFQVSPIKRAAYDDFAAAFTLDPHGGRLTTENRGATKERGEPFHYKRPTNATREVENSLNTHQTAAVGSDPSPVPFDYTDIRGLIPGRVTDPDFFPNDRGSRSIWFEWTALADDQVQFSTAGSGINTAIAVYQGKSLEQLIAVPRTRASRIPTGLFTLDAIKGRKYYITVDGVDGAEGEITLSWHTAPDKPRNDNFREAAPILNQLTKLDPDTGKNFTNVGATLQDKEPARKVTGGRSVWFFWEAKNNGRVTCSTMGSTFDTLLAIYEGPKPTKGTFDGFTLVDENDDPPGDSSHSSLTVDIKAGKTYYVMVDGYNGASGDINLLWDFKMKNSQGALQTVISAPSANGS